jgi:hypothetical protein
MTHRIAAARRTGQLDRSVWISATAGHLADGWVADLPARHCSFPADTTV